MCYGWLGKKYEDLSRKNANIKGKRWKKGGKFSLYLWKKISFWKKGGGAKILSYLDIIHPCKVNNSSLYLFD